MRASEILPSHHSKWGRTRLLYLGMCLSFLVFGCGDDDPSGPGGGSPVARTRNVPADFATIQAAVDASRAGDLVLVAAGSYDDTHTLDVEGVPITVCLELPAGVTVRGAGKGVTILGSESAQVTIYVQGAVVEKESSDPIRAALEDLTIAGHRSVESSGPTYGVGCDEAATLRVERCRFDYVGPGDAGLALAIAATDASDLQVVDCSFHDWGAAVLIERASRGLLQDVEFEDVELAVIAENAGTALDVVDCRFVGGEIAISIDETGSCNRVDRCVFVGVETAIRVYADRPLVTHSTFYGGQTALRAQGPEVRIDVVNSIVWGVSTPVVQFAPAVYFTHCCVQGGVDSESDGGGNIAVDPRFAGPVPGNLALAGDSPCRDVGKISFAWGCDSSLVDFSGFAGVGPDLGAIEGP